MAGDRHHDAHLYAFGKFIDDAPDTLDAFKVVELDAWKVREDFFALRENDNDKLRRFLDKTGMFQREGSSKLLGHWSAEVMEHYRKAKQQPLVVAGVWNFRESLNRALLNKKAFKEDYAPLVTRPGTGLQMIQQRDVEFPLSLELTNVASGVVTVWDTYHALLATVFFDIARGIRFKTCARKDCGKAFPLESKHKKKFCCWYCGHLVSVRKGRPGQAKKSTKPRAT